MASDEVFRFISVRTPSVQKGPSHDLSKASLGDSISPEISRDEAKSFASAYRDSDAFIDLEHPDVKMLRRVVQRNPTTEEDWNSVANDVLGPVDEYLASIDTSGFEANLQNSLLILHILGKDAETRHGLGEVVRTLTVLRSLGSGEFDDRLFARAIRLPAFAVKRVAAPTGTASEEPNDKDVVLGELLSIDADDIEPDKGELLVEEAKESDGSRQEPIVIVKPERVEGFSEDAKSLLRGAGFDLRRLPAGEVRSFAIHQKSLPAQQRSRPGAQYRFIGNGIVVRPTDLVDEEPPPKDLPDLTPDPPLLWSALPKAFSVKIGNLLKVQSELVRYELGEIAHIENVLGKENRKRTHRYLHRTEDRRFVSTERLEETEKSLQTTERFELQTETSLMTRGELGLEASGKVSASYGTTYSVEGSTKASAHVSVEVANKKSTAYAKEVVDKAVNKIKERVHSDRETRTLDEVEETNEHGFANDTSDNIVGVYRWIDKVYRMQSIWYGRRMLLEFHIPEPAVNYLRSLGMGYAQDILEEPEPFNLTPSAVTDAHTPFYPHYTHWVHVWRAEGVEPPPEPFVTVSYTKPFKIDKVHSAFHDGVADTIAITPLYRAVRAHITVEWLQLKAKTNTAGDDNVGVVHPIDHSPLVRMGIGRNIELFRKEHLIDGPDDNPQIWSRTIPLDGEVGQLPIAMTVYFEGVGTVTVEVECELTEHGRESWQLQTFDQLNIAYRARLEEYENKKTLVEIKQRAKTDTGLQRADFEQVEREELKRAAIEILRQDVVGTLDAFDTDATNWPSLRMEVANLLTTHLGFFEEVFEWGQASYDFYPYFWGAKSRWLEKLTAKVSDEDHRAFMRAGAAKFVVPVQPGRELDVVYFLNSGTYWRGDGPPDLDSGISVPYQALLEELNVDDFSTVEEAPIETPWEVTLPTQLVRLQRDSLIDGVDN